MSFPAPIVGGLLIALAALALTAGPFTAAPLSAPLAFSNGHLDPDGPIG